MTTPELNTILPAVINAAKQAGAFIRSERGNFSYDRVEIKGLNDMVSYVDKTAETMVVKALRNIPVQAGFIAEENTANEKGEYNWIIDPLDGTTNFVHGVPCYAVSIGLEYQGAILLGVVYEVSRDECFYAVKNGGAFLNGNPIKTSSRKNLSESLIATGFPIYNFTRIDDYLQALKFFMQHTHGVRRIGAASADLCYLACGRMDAFFEYNLSPWDVAAGALIASEAGGTLHDFSGGGNWLFGREMSCTNGALEQEFNEVIRKFFRK